MSKNRQLSEVWLKAAILGSTWAASEIILGSFLHNLRIPFNGNILTAIGFILLIAASYRWKDKGLFWRSGLICALMKTMSPSAVIFGPMIAIFMEALLLELAVRTLGRNILGFLVGTSLAMTWILFQKIFNLILFYGFNLVEIYKQLMGFASRQLGTNADLVWTPILVLLCIYLLFGLVAVYFGMQIGKSLGTKDKETSIPVNTYSFDILPGISRSFPYSITWLILNFILLTGMMFLINMTGWQIWIPATLLLTGIWVMRYKRGLRQLSRPKFWIWFVVITMITAFVITGLNHQADRWMEGLTIGLRMNFRAAVVIVGFTVLGTELYNPRIREFFARTSFRQLPVALELAFETLPVVIRYLPEVRTFFTRPGAVIRQLIRLAEQRFDTLRKAPEVILLTGDYAGGKTSFLQHLIPLLKEKNIRILGFYAPRIMDGEETVGYDLTDAVTGVSIPFLRKAGECEAPDIGKYMVNNTALDHYNQLFRQAFTEKTLVIIDEVGRWETRGKGWHDSIGDMLAQPEVVQLWALRSEFVEPVKEKFDLAGVELIRVEDGKTEEAFRLAVTKLHR